MSEGLAGAITIGSIILTAASLTLAVVFARKRSRIRIGFDLARAVVGIGAILVMAAATRVTTPTEAIAAAVFVGVALGFAQGAALEISPGERGFYAKRSPLGIVLWGAGIVIMQVAGIASRTGTVRIGQTIAWFSACLGIGLMVGRRRPLHLARQTIPAAAIVVILALVLLPSGVVAADIDLTAEDLCGLAPFDSITLDDGDGVPDAGSILGPATADGVGYCGFAFGGYMEDGVRYNAGGAWVYLFPSAAAAEAHFLDTATVDGLAIVDTGIGDQYLEGELVVPVGHVLVMAVRGPFVFQVVGDPALGDIDGAMREMDGKITPLVQAPTTTATTSSPVTTTPETTTGATSTVGTTAPEPTVPVTEGGEPAADEPIDPEEAAAQAIAGLVAAAAIGVISWAEAAAEIGRILSGEGTGGIPPVRTRTVVISGAEAEAVINGGPGSSVAIPTDQQSDLVASVPGEKPITEGRVGSVGVVRSVGAIVRGPDGSVSVSVEVDAFDPPPPPPIRIEPIIDTPPEPEMVPPRPPDGEPPPLPEIDEIYAPPPDAEPVPARPPTGETPPEPPPGDELPPEPPPVDEPPPEGELPPGDEPPTEPPPGDELPPEPPPVDEPPPEGEPPPGDEVPPDEEIPPVDEPSGDELSPDGPAPEVALEPTEIDDFVRWGVERNRSPEDILQDLEGYNRARGGTGPIELPEPLVQVDTSAGPVTVTASEAARYDEAMAQVERLTRERDALRREMAGLDNDAAWWGGAEQFVGERLMAGTEAMSSRIMETGARISEIDDELARLSRRPDPMIWDFKRAGMATREEAFESWENRHSHGWHHDQIQQLRAERNRLNTRLTDDLGEYRTTAADDTRLSNARDRLAGIEDGTRPPDRIDFEHLDDPEEEYYAALEDWRTRETSGRYFDEAERLREEIAARESLTHVSDVEPARPGDRGTVFDRPARELARIAEEQDRTMGSYREVDRQIDAAQSVIDDVTRRGSRD